MHGIMSLPRIQSSLEKIEAQITETQAEIKRVEELMRGARGESNTKFESVMEDANAKFTSLKTELSAMRNEVNAMRSGVSVKLDSLEKRVVNLEIVFKKLEESLRQA